METGIEKIMEEMVHTEVRALRYNSEIVPGLVKICADTLSEMNPDISTDGIDINLVEYAIRACFNITADLIELDAVFREVVWKAINMGLRDLTNATQESFERFKNHFSDNEQKVMEIDREIISIPDGESGEYIQWLKDISAELHSRGVTIPD